MGPSVESIPPLHSLADVTIGVLTALEEEFAACRAVFDPNEHGRREHCRASSGSFTCWLCSIEAKDGGHHIVAISLLTEMGNNAAAIGANILLQHCANVRALIMCGIAGAIPSPEKAEDHVRLGDIVVSTGNGIVQYDRGKQFDRRSDEQPLEGFQNRSPSRPPCPDLLQAVKHIHADEKLLNKLTQRRWECLVREFIERVSNPSDWQRPKSSQDKLNDSPNGTGPPVRHPRDTSRRSGCPRVFRGPIGSANVVQASPRFRDALRDRHKIKAVEMEGSGISDVAWMSGIGYLVVRGTCDYCNSEKNEVWHHYAALIAAAYSRTVVEYLPPYVIKGPDHAPAMGTLNRRSAPHNLTMSLGSESSQQVDVSHAIESAAPVQVQDRIFEPPAMISPDFGATAVPATEDRARQAEADIDLYRVFRVEDLTKALREILKDGRFSDAEVYTAELERELQLLPRKGAKVREGWTALAQAEVQRAIRAKQDGRPNKLNRLRALREEAENVVD